MPITATSTRPDSSISVQPMLKPTDSLIPRKLMSESTAMTTRPTSTVGRSTNSLR